VVTVMIRPEQIVRTDAAELMATVTAVRYEGPTVHVRLAVDTIEVTGRWSAAGAPVPGTVHTVGVRGPVMAYAT